MDHMEPPMNLGETLKGTDADSNLINGHWLGKIFTFSADRLSGDQRGQKSPYTGRQITAVLLRNLTAAALLGKRMGRLRRSGGYGDFEGVNGYGAVTGEKWLVGIDDKLPSAGVAANDIFWGILDGPFTVLTPFEEAGVTATVALGDELVGATAATTGTSGAGRACVAVVANATDAAGAAAVSRRIGRALSARTTGETNADLLVALNVRHMF